MTLKDEQLEVYAASRRTQRGAESYATKYDRELHKRISSFFERRVIRRALARTGGKHARVLDVPCGAGRLTPELLPSAELLVSSDYSRSMLGVFARRHGRPCFVGNALRLPFADRTFDLVFSARLSHHMSERQRREEYLSEVLRASDRWAVVTIFDSASLKSRLRNLRGRSAASAPRTRWAASRSRPSPRPRGSRCAPRTPSRGSPRGTCSTCSSARTEPTAPGGAHRVPGSRMGATA